MTNENGLNDDIDSAEVLSGRQIARRIEMLVNATLSLIDCDATEAECWAYEAGRYAWEVDAETPERLAPYPVLAGACKNILEYCMKKRELPRKSRISKK